MNTINTCILALGDNWQSIRTLAFYSHLIPVFFALGLSILVFLKAKKSLLSKIFLAFSFVFSLWLIGDLITWTSSNYYLLYTSWAPLDYIEIVFYILGLYFAMVFTRKNTLPLWAKLLFIASTLPPFFITIFQKSVTGFNYPQCEAFNNNFLGQYN